MCTDMEYIIKRIGLLIMDRLKFKNKKRIKKIWLVLKKKEKDYEKKCWNISELPRFL